MNVGNHDNRINLNIWYEFLFRTITQVLFWIHRKRAGKNIISDWLKFLNAEQSNGIDLINIYGDKLIGNRYISQDQIDILKEVLALRLNDHSIGLIFRDKK